MPETSEERQQRATTQCFLRTGLTPEQLWARYFALGGDADMLEVEGYLHGLIPLARLQRDTLSHAVNERLDETGPVRAPYSRTFRQGKPGHGPLAALLDLLDGAHGAPPERLPSVMAEAGRALDLSVEIYLVDYGQQLLMPTPSAGPEHSTPLNIDSTEAGRAFQQTGTVVVEDESGSALWTVLLDGVERLGVLRITPTDETPLDDPVLREQCRWLANLCGHLITVTTQYGDGLDTVRRRRSRDPAAELLWQSLPPLTAATDDVVVAGVIEPAYEISSDAFDYALSENKAWVALFDVHAGFAEPAVSAVTALSAYRAARRDGLGLRQQEQAVAEAFGPDSRTTASGVLAELDLRSGALRYLGTGHPPPLVVRESGRVETLTEGRLSCFTDDLGQFEPAVVRLAPGDSLVLYTDGVTDACDAEGRELGHERLVRTLEEAVPAQTPSEVARRVTREVLAHTGGRQSDDATVLLVRWLGHQKPGNDPQPFSSSP